ncbi:MAG: hypothetical protein GY771_03770 [bacterium]|nr:hypothetical protein [bacterium]
MARYCIITVFIVILLGPLYISCDSGPVGYSGDGVNPNWFWEAVAEDDILKLVDIDIDATGKTHIIYVSEGEYAFDSLKYAIKAGGEWTVETVYFSRCNIDSVHLETDAEGTPHILFPVELSLYYGYRTGTGWETRTVCYLPEAYSFTVDSSGNPHVVFNNPDLFYAYFDGSEWYVERIATYPYSVFIDNDIALDSSGNPYITLCSEDSDEYEYNLYFDLYYRDGTNWYKEELDRWIGFSDEFRAEIEISADDTAHIVYYDFRYRDLRYKRREGNDWSDVIVDSDGVVGIDANLALTPGGRPCVSYRDVSNEAIKFAYLNGEAWLNEVVLSDVETAAMTLDAEGIPHISFVADGYVLRAYRLSGF